MEESPEVYADAAYMAGVDLIVQCMTMTTIEKDEFAGLRAAVEAGTGLAGWHGGIADSYRNSSDYLHLIGGQFACHPGKHPDERSASSRTTTCPTPSTCCRRAADHPITAGIEDFELVTEQYWVLSDDYIDVLATTTQPVRRVGPLAPAESPRRRSGPGSGARAGSSSPPPATASKSSRTRNVRTIIERGMLWASR